MADESLSPTVRYKRLMAELTRLRRDAGLTREEAGERLDWGPQKIWRMETGRARRVQTTDIRALLDLYGVTDDRQRDALIQLARESRKRGWWHSYRDAIPEWFETYVGLEAEASELRNYQSEFIPGLLQTEDYTRAVHRAAVMTEQTDEIEKRVHVRMARQERLAGSDAPKLWAVVNEAVVRRTVGGPKSMRDQLNHLLDSIRLPNVTLQVLPYGAGAHPAMGCSFMILGFPKRAHPDVVYVENLTGSLYVEDTDDVDRYTLAFNHLMAKALDPDESSILIRQVAQEL